MVLGKPWLHPQFLFWVILLFVDFAMIYGRSSIYGLTRISVNVRFPVQ